MAAQTTFWNRRRFRRWMMIGTAIAVRPASMMGFKKDTIAFSLAGRSHAEGQVGTQDLIERVARVDLEVVALVAFATFAQAG